MGGLGQATGHQGIMAHKIMAHKIMAHKIMAHKIMAHKIMASWLAGRRSYPASQEVSRTGLCDRNGGRGRDVQAGSPNR
jgi:hypothetical protein